MVDDDNDDRPWELLADSPEVFQIDGDRKAFTGLS
jgi:hypothetical protein